MREIRCKRCREMFEFAGINALTCPACLKEKEAQLEKVRTLLKESPGITAMKVHELTGVPVNIILRFIEGGMIEAVPAGRCTCRESMRRAAINAI